MLCVLSNVGLYRERFSMSQDKNKKQESFQTWKPNKKILTGWPIATFLTHWILANECYTLIVGAYSTNFARIDMKVQVLQTQTAELRSYEIDLPNILCQCYDKDELPQIFQEDVEVKLENQNIFIKGQERSFFC